MKTPVETKQSSSIKHGDVVRLGDHILYCGNAQDIDLANLLEGRTISCLACDPPYSVEYAASKRGIGKIAKDKDIANDGFMTDKEYTLFTKSWLSPALPHLSKKNSIYVFNSDKMIFALRQAFIELDLKVAQLIIWVKSQPILGRLDYLPQHELILYGWKGTHEWRRGKDKSVMFAPKPSRSALHPTMKPVSLMRRIILNATRVGDIVYDPFGGSGTTLIACEHTKRRCIMVEMDLEHCETIIKRWEKLTGHGTEIIRSEGAEQAV